MAYGDPWPGGVNTSPGPYYIPQNGTSVHVSGGGGGGNAYSVAGGGGGSVSISGGAMQIGPPFAPSLPSIFETLNGQRSPNKLTPQQLERLMDHQFVPMDNDPRHSWCLLCYALDTYRTQADHDFVIHEE